MSRGVKVVVQLEVQAVTCPGVSLPRPGMIHLYVSLIGFRGRTQRVSPVFPLIFNSNFECEKVYRGALNFNGVQKQLDRESVFVEMVQETSHNAEMTLASFECSASEILFPYPRNSPHVQSVGLDLIMDTTRDFPSCLSPKLEVMSKTVVSPEPSMLGAHLDATLAGLNYIRPHTVGGPWVDQTGLDRRPPFVVRHVSAGLIGRYPGRETENLLQRCSLQQILPPKHRGFHQRCIPGDTNWDYSPSPPRQRKAHGWRTAVPAGCNCANCGEIVGPHDNERCDVCRTYREFFGREYAGRHGATSSPDRGAKMGAKMTYGYRMVDDTLSRKSPVPSVRMAAGQDPQTEVDSALDRSPETEADKSINRSPQRVAEKGSYKTPDVPSSPTRRPVKSHDTKSQLPSKHLAQSIRVYERISDRPKGKKTQDESIHAQQKLYERIASGENDPNGELFIPSVDPTEYDSHDESTYPKAGEIERGHQQRRLEFYDNMERFYEKLYFRAKAKAKAIKEKL